MTERALRDKVIVLAKSYLGCNEADGSHRKIIDLYNSQNPLPVGYRVTYTDAWCATFVSAVGLQAGLQDIIFPECGCGRMIELYKRAGRWMESDAYVPSPADIIMYDWQDSGVGDNQGEADHVGYVCSVDNGLITVIEGNINDAVGYRRIAVDGRYIRGYCLPDYAKKAKELNAMRDLIFSLTDEEAYYLFQKAQKYAATLGVPGWAKVELEKAKEYGITDGTRPQAFVTRVEAAIMAERAAET